MVYFEKWQIFSPVSPLPIADAKCWQHWVVGMACVLQEFHALCQAFYCGVKIQLGFHIIQSNSLAVLRFGDYALDHQVTSTETSFQMFENLGNIPRNA